MAEVQNNQDQEDEFQHSNLQVNVPANESNCSSFVEQKRPNLDSNNNLMAVESNNGNLKEMGWYWGSISPDYAAKLLQDEPDGSFLIRDSSSECYIFSMTFKLKGRIRHSRIDHTRGCFSFGRSCKVLCHTIVEFIHVVVEYSHTGKYTFFLHRDPSMEGPVCFKMIPLSRLKSSSSLRQLCRSAILPYIRKNMISDMPIPECLKEYLNEPFCRDQEAVIDNI